MDPLIGTGLLVATFLGFRAITRNGDVARFRDALDLQIRPWAGIIFAQAASRNLDPFTVAAIVQTESDGNPAAVGDGGHSIGLMQINDRAWPELHRQFDLRDPEQNVRAGTFVLMHTTEEARERSVPEGSVPLVAIAAYNAGIGRAMDGYRSGDPGRYTHRGIYLDRVLGFRNATVARWRATNEGAEGRA